MNLNFLARFSGSAASQQLLLRPTIISSSSNSNFHHRRSVHSSNLSSYAEYKTFLVSTSSSTPHVLHVQLNRPEKRNALNKRAFLELGQLFKDIAVDTDCRAVVLSGSGKLFCSGIDYTSAKFGAPEESPQSPEARDDIAARSRAIRYNLAQLQSSISQIEKCTKPVIAAIHGGCIGAGFAVATATDIRFGTEDSYYSIREVDLGLACDLGTLQRLPKICGSESVARQMAFSGMNLPAQKALKFGILSEVFPDPELCVQEALKLAASIAAKSPVAVQGTKYLMNYSRDNSVAKGLELTTVWNSTMLQSEDVKLAVGRLKEKKATAAEGEVEFRNL
ncbi:putative enoyl CoA hydratase [Tyrophagus putrescentiae]|nr:putative enoyl CoA hydratase [Tyrophagus putrescentiae]